LEQRVGGGRLRILPLFSYKLGNVIDRDQPLLRVAFQRLAAQAKQERAALLLRAARVMVWVSLEPHRRACDSVGPGGLVAVAVGYEA
jgi:hypothetical protein